MCNGIRTELHLVCWEVLHHERRQKTIFPKRQQILLVESVDVGLRVFVDDAVRNDDRSSLISCPNAIQTETARETGNRAEQALECLCKVVRNIVLVDLIVNA
jgi:hypothetical protein